MTTVDDPRVRLLEAADTLMHRRGYEAVGVADLCRAADVRKGSFYHFFESKQALALEMLERSWQRTRETIFASSLGDDELGALDAVDRYGNLLADNLGRIQAAAGADDGDPIVGCRFGNFAVELSTRDDTIRLKVESVFDEMIAEMAATIERGVASGELAPDTDTTTAATDVFAHMEGLMVLAKARRDPSVLRSLGDGARRLLT